MKKLSSILLTVALVMQMAPFAYAQALIIEPPVMSLGSNCATDSGTTPGVIEYHFCEDGACRVTNTITCLPGYYCKQEGDNATCAKAAESTSEFVDDIDLSDFTTPPVLPTPVVPTPEPAPEVPEVEDETPEPEKIDLPEIELIENEPIKPFGDEVIFDIVAEETKEREEKEKEKEKPKKKTKCKACEEAKEFSDKIHKGVERTIGFDPRKTKNGFEQASLAMTNNFAQNAGTTIALGVAYPFAIGGGIIADVVTGIPIGVARLFGSDAEYVGATGQIHDGFAKGFKKAMKAIWSVED